MKNKHLLFALALVLSVGFTAFGQVGREGKVQVVGDGNQTVKDLDPMNAANWLSARRVNQYTGTIDIADIVRAQEQVKALTRKGGNSLNMEWNELGPNNIGGRTRAFLIDKDNPDVCFAGSVSGGLWKTTTGGSTWEKTQTTSGGLFENLAVSSICQASNGDIYFGTGEGPATTSANTEDSHFGVVGQGIWKSTDHGVTFGRLESTWSSDDSKATFALVYALSADPTNASKLYAATAKGLRVSTDGGQLWTNPIPETTAIAYHVKVATDGTVLACVGSAAYRSADGSSFVKISAVDGLKNQLIQDKDVSRLMFAFAPSDPNYVYCVATGTTKSGTTITGYPLSNIYQSKDKGIKWSVIGPGGSAYFQPLGTEGNYACALDVSFDDPGFILIGGKDMYSWSYKTGWERITLDEPMDMPNRGFYVHRDQHTIVFSKRDSSTVFVGTSGGIAVSNNKGISWRTLNRNYNVTQFLTVASSPKGELLGGSMDNGILYMDFQGNDPKYATWWAGALFSTFLGFRHGGECEISTLDPNFKYYTTPGGVIHRRMVIEGQTTYQEFYGAGTGGVWISPFTIWESFDDKKSWDSVDFIADRDYNAGETVVAQSLIKKYPLTKVLTQPLLTGENVRIQDTYQSIIAFGKNGQAGIKTNRHPLSGVDVYRTQSYSVIVRNRLQGTAPNIDRVVELAFSNDGNHLFSAVWDASDKNYKIYRVSNMENARDRRRTDTDTGFDPITGLPTYVETTATIGSFTQVVTCIAVDPTDPNNVLVSTGNWGNPNYIYLCRNAITAEDKTENFTQVQGNLPQAPVYSILYNTRDNNEVIVGTEYGVYSTSDIYLSESPEWASENRSGMEIIPVFQLRQQRFQNKAEFGIENHGVVYAATFGRGLFSSNTFASKGGSSSSKLQEISNIDVKITPNPVSDMAFVQYSTMNDSNINFQIYDLQGKLVKTINLPNQPAGANQLSIDAAAFAPGTYLIRMTAGTQQSSSKFAVK
ncbi:MAG: T9SS type A sorting domain-containing protein [Bacteroidia bacterium]|nr:T9SS type A sorting domain-containing protein [Bacteroidia bacterium]